MFSTYFDMFFLHVAILLFFNISFFETPFFLFRNLQSLLDADNLALTAEQWLKLRSKDETTKVPAITSLVS